MADDVPPAGPLELDRGGILIETPAGPLQFGAPSETIKDTLRTEGGVPQYFLLGKNLFDPRRGVAFADIEFPIYFNVFAKQRPLKVVTTPAHADRVIGAVREALLGPDELTLDEDFAPGQRIPDLRKELEYFRRGESYKSGMLDMEDALELILLDGGVAELPGGVVIRELDDGFTVSWDGQEQARLPADPPLPPPLAELEPRLEPFVPPAFGVTTLGRSHGFDPDPREKTSGFVLWVGGRGVMVDPPVRSLDVLRGSEIDLEHMHAILLTHCHADHDAGTLEQALIGGKRTLYTTPTIFRSYRRKWSLLSGIPEDELEKLFDFRPVHVGAPMVLEGAEFLFRYTLHAIPTIAFEVFYRNRSFNYSSDTLNDPARIDAIFAAGGMDRDRREELLGFEWGSDLIFHESGVPPLHTQLEVLLRLPEHVKKRVVIVHITPARLENDEHLRVALPGRAGTLSLDVEESAEEGLLRRLRMLGRARLFAGLPLGAAADLLAASTTMQLCAGDRLITQGDEAQSLFVITAGKAAVLRDGHELKVYGVGDYLGETAVFLGQPRNADVVAKTRLELLAIDGESARAVCAGTDVEVRVRRQARVRELQAWDLFEETELFSELTATQKTELESLLEPRTWQAGELIYARSSMADGLLLLHTGEVTLTGDGERVVKRGALLGSPQSVLQAGRREESATAKSEVLGLVLSSESLRSFLDHNPSVRVRVQPWSETKSTSSEAAGLIELLEELM